MALMVLLSVGLGWIGMKFREAETQRKAVEAIRKAGGWVTYDYERTKHGYLSGSAEPPAPAWLRKLVGDDFFGDVLGVCLYPPVGDAALGHVSALADLETLWLSDTDVTDKCLEHLTGLRKLNTLELSNTEVSDRGLVNFKGLTKLNTLGLSGTEVSDEGLENLKGLTRLRVLNLMHTRVTEAGINELRRALPDCGIHWTELEDRTPKTPILPPNRSDFGPPEAKLTQEIPF